MINRKNLFNECLICPIQQLRHRDGCAIKLFFVRLKLFRFTSSNQFWRKAKDWDWVETANGKVVFLIFFIARSLQHLLALSECSHRKLWSEKAKLKENRFIKPFHVSHSFLFFFVNYRLMIVKNFINAIKVFVRVLFVFPLEMRNENERLVS